MDDHTLFVPVEGPLHVFCEPLTVRQVYGHLDTFEGTGNGMKYAVELDEFPLFELLFYMDPREPINIRANRSFYDLSGCQVTITGPAAFRGLTEYAAFQTVKALSI